MGAALLDPLLDVVGDEFVDAGEDLLAPGEAGEAAARDEVAVCSKPCFSKMS